MANRDTPRRTRRVDIDMIVDAKASIDGFLAVVERGDLVPPTPRDTAVLRRLQGASDALGAVIETS